MMFTANDINSEYTNIVAKYLNDGYVIDSSHMGSSYTNVLCYVDLYNNKDRKHFIRVWKYKSTEKKYKEDSVRHFLGVHTVCIAVKQYDHRILTAWLESGDTLYEKKFYELKDNQAYETDMDRIREIDNIRNERWHSNFHNYDVRKLVDTHKLSNEFVTNMVNRVRKNYGCKKATSDCIKEVEINKQYGCRLCGYVRWSFNNRSGIITLK